MVYKITNSNDAVSVTIEYSGKILKTGFRRDTIIIRNKMCKGVSYFGVTEPQKDSGYPHIHACYLTEFSITEKIRLKTYWSEVMKAGDCNHGLDSILIRSIE